MGASNTNKRKKGQTVIFKLINSLLLWIACQEKPSNMESRRISYLMQFQLRKEEKKGKEKKKKRKKIDFIYLRISIKQFLKHWEGNKWKLDSRIERNTSDDFVTLFFNDPHGFHKYFCSICNPIFYIDKPELMFCILIHNLTNYHE